MAFVLPRLGRSRSRPPSPRTLAPIRGLGLCLCDVLLGWADSAHAEPASKPGVPRASEEQKTPVSPEGSEKPAQPADDRWPDLSNFLDKKFGFLPVAVPITEPAIGYGGAAGLGFVSKPLGAAAAGFGRPNITFVGGMGTESRSWAVAAGDMRYWLDDRLQTLVGGGYSSIHLDFHGIGKDAVLADDPLSYELTPAVVVVQAKYRIADSRFWAGLNYVFAYTGVSFDAPADTPQLPDFDSESRIGGLNLTASYDSRDNAFTPLHGTFVEATAGFFGKAMGGEDRFERIALAAIQYFAFPHQIFLGLRGDAAASFGDAPFYVRPFINMRGVPMMRYQGEEIAQLEVELRWQFWRRLSVVAFGGGGGAWNNLEKLDNATGVIAGGPGVRYEIARRYGIHMGVDVGFSPDTTAVYLQMGSAWPRP